MELATLYADLGNYRAAVPKYEAALKLGVAQNNDFNENYGYALIYSAQFEKGEEKILEIYKKKGNKEILRELANTLYKLKQYDRCLDYCQKLMEADPKDGKALYQAGLSFIKLGKKDKRFPFFVIILSNISGSASSSQYFFLIAKYFCPL